MNPARAHRKLDDAMACHRRGDLAGAEAGYRDVLRRQPDNADALHLLGTILPQRGDVESGIRLIERALDLNPKSPEAHFNLGNILLRLERLAEAEAHFRRTLELHPQNAEASNNVGGILLGHQRYAEAEEFVERALKINPNLDSALRNMGVLREIGGRLDETLDLYDRALRRQPQNAEIHHQRAYALLAGGRLAEGWAAYAWRLKHVPSTDLSARFRLPLWTGEPLAGSGILVWTEQGLGEELLAGTLVPELLASAKRVVVVCSRRIAPLFRRSFPAIDVWERDAAVDPKAVRELDVQASIADLGRALRPSLDAFPKANPYLKCDARRSAAFRSQYLEDRPRDRLVGISWRSPGSGIAREKSTDLREWMKILNTPGLTFVNLQYGPARDDVMTVDTASGIRLITDLNVDPLGDLDVFAAQIGAMDLVISVSNTTAHLAGALDRPTYALIPTSRGRLWYWFVDREDCLWYPNVRLFRQMTAPAWGPELARIAEALNSWR